MHMNQLDGTATPGLAVDLHDPHEPAAISAVETLISDTRRCCVQDAGDVLVLSLAVRRADK